MLVTTISWSELSGNLADRMLQSFHDRTAFPGTHDQGRGGDHAIAYRSDDPRNRIAMVPEVTHDLLTEMYAIRLRLEGWAAEEAATKVSVREISELRSIAGKLDAREAGGHAYDAPFLALSHKFFFIVYAAARMPLLLNLIDGLWLRSSSILGIMHKKRPNGFTVGPQRAVLVAALDKHDPKAARQAIEQIVVATRDMVIAAVAAEEESLPAKKPARAPRKR